ncbi:caldesmon isoform X1 [Manis pentadactyla]|uniref:caldesmon isoform X1 n=1 Tax=Manis pentadactyla TaxID=143292 RepID=UPI00255C8F4B|nr:caldesmon isoform X1 [Manis pentadactyla]
MILGGGEGWGGVDLAEDKPRLSSQGQTKVLTQRENTGASRTLHFSHRKHGTAGGPAPALTPGRRRPSRAADMLAGSGPQGRRSLAALSQIAYQRNDDDEEEAARERRRRARQERLRQKQEEESLGQVTDQVEVNAQNSVPDEEVKASSTNTQAEGGDEAALLERLARREERRQKRLQEALERQKEFDPTIADAGLSLPSRRLQNDTAENDSAEKEEKSESHRERYEMEETEIATKSYQKNDWRDDEGKKKDEKEKEQEEEEKPKRIEDNQVEVTGEENAAETVVMSLKNGQVSAEEREVEEEREQEADEITPSEKLEAEGRERAEAERVRLEAEERERVKAEQEQKIAEEKARIEAEEKAAAQERERREAEERERIREEERRAAEQRQRAKAEEEQKAKAEEQTRKKQLAEKRSEMQEKKIKGEKVEEKIEGKQVNAKKAQEDKLQTAVQKKQEEEKGVKVQAKREKTQEDKPTFKKEEIKDEKIKKDKEPKEVKSLLDGKKGFTEVKSQNGEFMTHKLKHTENTFSRAGAKASEAREAEGAPQVEAGRRLEELRRRRGETESEEFEKLKQKQQEAALELEELKKKREERKKVLEEEEQRRKQEEAERKVREEEEKRRLKEEIEKRRAEAAEKRQKMPEDGLSEEKKPFKCFTPKGSSLKIEERAEFLNKSVQKSSGVKPTHQAAVVSKIDSRLEQYTSAIEGTKTAKPAKPAASDLPVPAEGVRNIKSMWEKGNVFSSPTASGTPNKETAGLKVGVSSRINEWLTKTPDGNKSPAPKPSDLRPGDVSGKRNLWEKQSVDKVTSPTKEPVSKETHAVK